MLEIKHVDLSMERKNWINEGDMEKRQLVQEINDLQQRIESLQSEFDFQRAQLNKEIESINAESAEANRLLEEMK